MTVSSIIKIGDDQVDLNQPCHVALALRKRKLAVVSGVSALTVRMDREEVTFTRANVAALDRLIAEYESKCLRQRGQSVGGARRIRFF